MTLKENESFKLPRLTSGSFSGLDRLDIPHNLLTLTQVNQRLVNGDIEIVTKATNGPEEKRGRVRFLSEDRLQKDALVNWFREQVGKDIKTIYDSDFSFGGKKL